MGFLIRIMLFLGLIILFIPADEAETKKLGSGQSLSLFDTFGFATAAYSDAEGFCDRNPRACSTGSGLVATFEAKARTGARWIYGYLEPSSAKSNSSAQSEPADSVPAPIPPLATGSIRGRQPVVTSVSIPQRTRADYLPLPPPRRPS